MLWTDTDENREAFAAWFELHDYGFETRGPIVYLPHGDHNHVAPGEWILYDDDSDEFFPMSAESFAEAYEEQP